MTNILEEAKQLLEKITPKQDIFLLKDIPENDRHFISIAPDIVRRLVEEIEKLQKLKTVKGFMEKNPVTQEVDFLDNPFYVKQLEEENKKLKQQSDDNLLHAEHFREENERLILLGNQIIKWACEIDSYPEQFKRAADDWEKLTSIQDQLELGFNLQAEEAIKLLQSLKKLSKSTES